MLGAGGVVGASWLVGALQAIEAETGWTPADADVQERRRGRDRAQDPGDGAESQRDPLPVPPEEQPGRRRPPGTGRPPRRVR